MEGALLEAAVLQEHRILVRVIKHVQNLGGGGWVYAYVHGCDTPLESIGGIMASFCLDIDDPRVAR